MNKGNNIKILDCTLRDGGYVVDSMFGDTVIKGILQKLTQAAVDIIEVGFLKDVNRKSGSTNFSVISEIEPFLVKKDSSFAVMIDHNRYSITSLKENDNKSINLRYCFFKQDRLKALDVVKSLKDKGYDIYIQPVDTLGYSDKELMELLESVNNTNPFAFSIVDTFGSMDIEDLSRIYSLVNNNLNQDISIGFHSHNNLQLSFALSKYLIDKVKNGERKVIIDSSLFGMGRGAGNTNTELVANYLNKFSINRYDINEIIEAIDLYIAPLMKNRNWGYSVPNFIAGIYSLHVKNLDYIKTRGVREGRYIKEIVSRMGKEQRTRYDFDYLEEVICKFNEEKVKS